MLMLILYCFLFLIFFFFFFKDPATTETYTSLHTLSLHDALPISGWRRGSPRRWWRPARRARAARRSPARPRSEEHTSELQSRNDISYAVFCLKKKKKKKETPRYLSQTKETNQ